ncbi:MAG: ABC transporter ATP-binding protein [Thermosulfidibacteraceae bacterium]
MSFIKLEGITHYYRLGNVLIKALDNVNIEIEKGSMIALVGASGSGKTTLINLIGKLDAPSEGKIIVDGKDITRLNVKETVFYRKEMVSFVFQFFNLLPTLNVYENIEFPLLFRSIPPSEIKRRINYALEMVDLTGFEKRKIDELSGGQRQRVAVARAVVTGAKIILADEPTANLDGATGSMVMDLMLEVKNKLGTTIIYSTHDPRVMEKADRIIRLSDGKVVN